MHTKYTKMVLFAAAVTALTSCSTAYKMGQTPDDVYYSPAKPQSESVASNDRDDSYYNANPRNNRYNNNSQQYSDPYYSGYDMYRNDRFLRLGIGNQYRWNGFNDYLAYDGLYNYNRFNTYSDFYFGSPYNSYSYWNSFYNPYSSFNYGYGGYYPNYGGGGIIIGGVSKYPTASYAPAARPRPFNPAGYSGNTFTNTNRYLNTNTYTNTPNAGGRYNNTNSRSNNSNSYYNNSNNNRANSYRSTTPSNSNNSFFNNNSNSNSSSRSYTPSSSSSGGSSSSGSSGGGGAVSRPTRGGN